MTRLTCSSTRRRLSAFHDRELAVRDQIAIESHLQHCLPCTRALQELQEVGQALRIAAAPGPSDDWTGLQPGVISRMRAEAHESWTARATRFLDDLHLVWIGLAATAATFLCGAVALSALHFGSPERRVDSLATALAVMAAPTGSNLNPVRLDERLGPRYSPLVDYLQAPSVPKEGPMEAMLLTPVSDEELMLALSAVVTREGRLSDLAVLTNDADRQEIGLMLEGIAQARLEPARAGSDPIAVNLVWLLTHTTVKAKKAPRTI
jgi:putative zinc finger protein